MTEPQKISPSNAIHIFSLSLFFDGVLLITKPFQGANIDAHILSQIGIVALTVFLIASASVTILTATQTTSEFHFSRKHLVVALGVIALVEIALLALQGATAAAPAGLLSIGAVLFLSKLAALKEPTTAQPLHRRSIFFVSLISTRILMGLCVLACTVTNGSTSTVIGIFISLIYFVKLYQVSTTV